MVGGGNNRCSSAVPLSDSGNGQINCVAPKRRSYSATVLRAICRLSGNLPGGQPRLEPQPQHFSNLTHRQMLHLNPFAQEKRLIPADVVLRHSPAQGGGRMGVEYARSSPQ